MAIPSVLMQLAKSNPMMQQIKQMMTMVNSAQNPQAMLNQMMMSNPHLKQAMDIVNQYGGDPEKAFRTVAEKNGLNPDDILNLLK